MKDRKLLCIHTVIDKPFSELFAKLRYTLEDTIEDRGLGVIVDSGIGDKFMEINIECTEDDITEIKSIVENLGLLNESSFEIK